MNAIVSSIKEDAQALAAHSQGADGLAAFRQQQQQQLADTVFPSRKSENWKYTSLQPLQAGQLQQRISDDSHTAVPDLGAAMTVVIRNGNATLPSERVDGITITTLSHAPEQANTDMQGPFITLNGAALDDGILIRVADNAQVKTLLHVVHIADSATPASTHSRIAMDIGANANVTLVEHYLGNGPALTNAVTRINVGANAQLTHYRLSSESSDSLHIGLLEFIQQRHSQVNSFQFMQGCTLRRNDVHAVMAESGADLNMKGIFIARGNSHIDNQVCVEHRVPHCTSDQVYKGMAGETGRGVFNGRIHIHPGAKGTRAELSNKNLLLNPGAEIDSKPELEIYNDDVQCAHGTTIGQMDAAQLFYLRSRGIDEHDAKRMLATGFINELLHAIPHDSVRAWAQPWLSAVLTEGL